MKRIIFVFCIVTLLIPSCNLLATPTPSPIPPTETPTVVPANTSTNGNVVTLGNVSLAIPTGLADDAQMEMLPATTGPDTPGWEIAPAHSKITLTGYPLQGKFHEPNVSVYPADEYVQVNSIADEQVDRLKRVLAGSPMLKETLPNVPFFNADPLISASIQLITFQTGSGVRELTQYAQYAAPINNHELFYHFQGLTEDDRYYLVAILPITAPLLAEDEKPDASVPTEGVPIPADIGPNDVYYASITQKLNSLSPDSFTPSLTSLDALIQSILVTDP